MESVKINTLEFENVKRIRAVALEPSPSGLTVIGGDNNQGKTSVLDTIAWALGGDRYRPSNPVRDGSVLPPNIRITLSNGLIVERTGKNSALKVTDPNGRKSGQQLLNSFIEELALNLPKFMESPDKEKANTLLQIIGVGDRLHELERKLCEFFTAIGQRKKGQRVSMNWNAVIGSRGRCKVTKRSFKSKNTGADLWTNDIEKFYAPADADLPFQTQTANVPQNTAPAGYTVGKF